MIISFDTAVVRDVNNEDESQDPFYEVKGIITLEGKFTRIKEENREGYHSFHRAHKKFSSHSSCRRHC